MMKELRIGKVAEMSSGKPLFETPNRSVIPDDQKIILSQGANSITIKTAFHLRFMIRKISPTSSSEKFVNI